MSLLDDLKEFNKQVEGKNRFELIKTISRRSHMLSKQSTAISDSYALTCSLYKIRPEIKDKENKITYSNEDDILSYVSNDDIIESVKKSLRCSSRESVNYIYVDTLTNADMSRVRVLVNMILDLD